jgi:hypothetical protein
MFIAVLKGLFLRGHVVYQQNRMKREEVVAGDDKTAFKKRAGSSSRKRQETPLRLFGACRPCLFRTLQAICGVKMAAKI